MEHARRHKSFDVLSISLKLYLAFMPVCFGLAAFLRYKDEQVGSLPPADWFYDFFSFGMPMVVVFAIWIIFLRDTSHRKDDPYRFTRNAFRYFRTSEDPMPRIKEMLEALGYFSIRELNEAGRIELEARRIVVRNTARFQDKRHPLPHKLRITASKTESSWWITVCGSPISAIVIADFRNTIYDALEEFTDELGWRDFMVSV